MYGQQKLPAKGTVFQKVVALGQSNGTKLAFDYNNIKE